MGVEKLKGGLADSKSLEDIAAKHNIPIADIEEQFKMGMEVEKEHTEDEEERAEIAKDHLWEVADYYTNLAAVENENLDAPNPTGGDNIHKKDVKTNSNTEYTKYHNSLDKKGEIRYIRHCKAGLVTYPDEVVLIQDDCLKQMMPSGAGIPLYIDHVNIVDMDKADGYVIESLYNQLDGCYWFKVIIIDFDAFMKVENGYGASNAYLPKQMAGGGLYHGAKYNREVIRAEYTHLAIVKNPRYNESMILTQEEYKSYNEKLAAELKELQNSLDTAKKEKNQMAGEEKTIAEQIVEGFKQIFNSADKDADDSKDKKIAELEEKLNCAMKKNEDYEAEKKAKEEEEKKNVEEEEAKKKEEEEKQNSAGEQFFNSLQEAAIKRGGDDDKVIPATQAQRLEAGQKAFS